MSNTIPFGKYKDFTFEEVAKKDGKYLIWLFKQEWVFDDVKRSIEEVMDSITLNFGRHQGETLSSIKTKDPKYHAWLFKHQAPKENQYS
jgi:uncharacterized protein (DUF3820 family)